MIIYIAAHVTKTTELPWIYDRTNIWAYVLEMNPGLI